MMYTACIYIYIHMYMNIFTGMSWAFILCFLPNRRSWAVVYVSVSCSLHYFCNFFCLFFSNFGVNPTRSVLMLKRLRWYKKAWQEVFLYSASGMNFYFHSWWNIQGGFENIAKKVLLQPVVLPIYKKLSLLGSEGKITGTTASFRVETYKVNPTRCMPTRCILMYILLLSRYSSHCQFSHDSWQCVQQCFLASLELW